jgi:hypothetical protein
MEPGKKTSVPEGAKLVTEGRHVGTVVDVKDGHVIQNAGRGQFVAHELDKFEKPPKKGDKLDINYRDGLAKVAEGFSHDNHSVSVSINTR